MRMRRSAALAVAAILTTGLAACGDDDDGGDALEQVDEGGSASGTEEGDGGGEEASGGDAGAGFDAESCSDFVEAFAEAGAAAGAGGGDVGEVATFFEEAAEGAPDEVADALQVYAEAYGRFAEALEDAGIDPSDPDSISDPQAAAVFAEAGQAFSSPEFTEASETLSEFTANNCEG